MCQKAENTVTKNIDQICICPSIKFSHNHSPFLHLFTHPFCICKSIPSKILSVKIFYCKNMYFLIFSLFFVYFLFFSSLFKIVILQKILFIFFSLFKSFHSSKDIVYNLIQSTILKLRIPVKLLFPLVSAVVHFSSIDSNFPHPKTSVLM